jgi:hypothetical protein
MNGLVLPAVLYGCETCSPTLRGKHRLTVFDAVFSSKIIGNKRDEVTGDCRRLRNKGLHDLYCLTKIIRVIKSRRMRWAGHVARMGGEEKCIQGFGWETRRKEPIWKT